MRGKVFKTLASCLGFASAYLVVLFFSVGIFLISLISEGPNLTGSEVSTKTILMPGMALIVGTSFFSILQYKSAQSFLGYQKRYFSFILVVISWMLAIIMSHVLGIW